MSKLKLGLWFAVLLLLSLLFFMSVRHPLWSYPTATPPQTSLTPSPVAVETPVEDPVANQPPRPGVPATTRPDVANVSAIHAGCTGQTYVLPGELTSANLGPGMTTQIDAPAYYQVYGRTIDEVRAAVDDCVLRQTLGEYHAVTAYNLTWSYGLSQTGGNCKVTNVKVGLHVNQYLPSLAAGNTSGQLQAHWNAYSASLHQHENGHVEINKQYSAKLLQGLQNISAPCATIEKLVSDTAKTYVTMLDAANELYDSRTDHGATQGAIL